MLTNGSSSELNWIEVNKWQLETRPICYPWASKTREEEEEVGSDSFDGCKKR